MSAAARNDRASESGAPAVDVLIVGGGASGFAAAIAAAETGARVLVLERREHALRKLAATGNGRCNLLNTGEPRYAGGGAFARAVLAHTGAREVAAFFARVGLTLREEDDGRVYPASLYAGSVVDAFRLRARQAGVTLRENAEVTRLTRAGDGAYLAATRAGETFRARRVVVAAGGAAAPKLGTDGTAYALLAGFGHRIVTPRPALTPLLCEKAPLRGLEGVRVRAAVRLSEGGRFLGEGERGEALFAADGVSGIAVMQLSRRVSERASGAASGAAPLTLHIDLREGAGLNGASVAQVAAFVSHLRDERAAEPASELLTGVLHPRLALAVLRVTGVRPLDTPCGALSDDTVAAVARAICDFSLRVTGTRGFDAAQVTAGGADTTQFSPDTMASLLSDGLYAAGEILDVDGDCGGFNLLFAFASGLTAGRSAGREAG